MMQILLIFLGLGFVGWYFGLIGNRAKAQKA